jgi:hypothetical protein
MKFLSIVKTPEHLGAPPQALLDAMDKLVQESIKNGSVVQTGGLAGGAKGVRVRLSAGKVTVTDGPFTETKESIGGYAILEAASREEAIANAKLFLDVHRKHWPAWFGECEVHEIVFLAP